MQRDISVRGIAYRLFADFANGGWWAFFMRIDNGRRQSASSARHYSAEDAMERADVSAHNDECKTTWKAAVRSLSNGDAAREMRHGR
jgi:hypothetical protein